MKIPAPTIFLSLLGWQVGHEEDEEEHRVTLLAWAAFQVLADRCVTWETQEVTVASSGLAQQVNPHTQQLD